MQQNSEFKNYTVTVCEKKKGIFEQYVCYQHAVTAYSAQDALCAIRTRFDYYVSAGYYESYIVEDLICGIPAEDKKEEPPQSEEKKPFEVVK